MSVALRCGVMSLAAPTDPRLIRDAIYAQMRAVQRKLNELEAEKAKLRALVAEARKQ